MGLRFIRTSPASSNGTRPAPCTAKAASALPRPILTSAKDERRTSDPLDAVVCPQDRAPRKSHSAQVLRASAAIATAGGETPSHTAEHVAAPSSRSGRGSSSAARTEAVNSGWRADTIAALLARIPLSQERSAQSSEGSTLIGRTRRKPLENARAAWRWSKSTAGRSPDLGTRMSPSLAPCPRRSPSWTSPL